MIRMWRVTALCLLLGLLGLANCKDKDADPSPAPPRTAAVPEAESAAPEESASATASGAEPAPSELTDTAAAGEHGDAAPEASAPDAGIKMTAAGRRFEVCCKALLRASLAHSARATVYEAAHQVCEALVTSLNIGAADSKAVRTTMRNQLVGVPLPNGC
jgi:hypothetical protein